MTVTAEEPQHDRVEYDAVKLKETYLGGIRTGQWNSVEEFAKALQAENPEANIVPGSLRRIAAKDGWKEASEEVIAHKQLAATGDRLDSMSAALYRDRDKATKLRRKIIKMSEWCANHPEDGSTPPKLKVIEKLSASLHRMEADIQRAIEQPGLDRGQPTYQITFVEVTPQWAGETGGWNGEKEQRAAGVVRVAKDGEGSPSEAQESVGGKADRKDEVRPDVAPQSSPGKSLPWGRMVHGSQLRVGEENRVDDAK